MPITLQTSGYPSYITLSENSRLKLEPFPSWRASIWKIRSIQPRLTLRMFGKWSTVNQWQQGWALCSYFSYGAAMQPSFWSMFRLSHRVLQEVEGYNDGLVSVASSKWGKYKGTLEGASHLDLINWTNRLKWLAGEITGNRQRFVKSISGFEVVH